MIRLWIAALQLSELFVSSLIHLLYGFYIFSSAVAGDLSQTLNDMFGKPNMNIEVTTAASNGTTTSVENLPPIVLVHGIFGFGKGVSFQFCLFLIMDFDLFFYCSIQGVLNFFCSISLWFMDFQ